MTADPLQLPPLPPEAAWIPGRLLESVVLHDSSTLHVRLDDGDVYPVGVLLRLSARFRSVRTLWEQREVLRQMGAFHQDPAGHDGPHLRYALHSEGGPPLAAGATSRDAHPWAHRGAQGFLRLNFWLDFDTGSKSRLQCILDWSAQGISAAFSFPPHQIDLARQQARRLWNDEGSPDDQYTVAL